MGCSQTNAVPYDQREAEEHAGSHTRDGSGAPLNNVDVGSPKHGGRQKPNARADAEARECKAYGAGLAEQLLDDCRSK